MAPPSGYQTPPVPPVTMLKESFWPNAGAPASAMHVNLTSPIFLADVDISGC
jgi:hypothetical protein